MFKLFKSKKEKLYTKQEVDEIVLQAVEKYRNDLAQTYYPAVIDFKKLNVFCIERLYQDGNNTSIGYFDSTGKVKQWFLRVSNEEYTKLLEEFVKFKVKID